MSTYDVIVWMKRPETYTVDLLRANPLTGLRPKKIFRNYSDLVFAMIDLGINRMAIDSMTEDFTFRDYAAIRQIQILDEAVVRFGRQSH
ncbi:MAG: hypothetical protein BGO25_02630 [Acidobacteriales bacterium 59-55]|nr:hypothetical protein [Terriglobales bacterium]OJV42415.1 MAG: hypothetical protein BGO25_02630 [Acidobacteriales bacterium 59-55]